MSDLVKQALLSLLPPGSAWTVKSRGDWDKTINGMAANWEVVRAQLDTLSEIRNPLTTPLLSDLEREYAILPDTGLTDAVRRQRLASLVYAPNGTGSPTYLQARLADAGFDVQVHSNDPAVDPVPYLQQLSGAQLGEPLFELGEEFAQLGSYSSEFIVAGDIFEQVAQLTATAGSPVATAGDPETTAGAAVYVANPIEYPDPTDPDRWRYVFFIGGDATRRLIFDGDMELAGTDFWTPIGNPAITKDIFSYEGTQSLKIVGSGFGDAARGTFQWQSSLASNQFSFRLQGRMANQNALNPGFILQGGVSKYTNPTTALAWEPFDLTLNSADGFDIDFGISGLGASNAIYVDDVTCTTTDGKALGYIESIQQVNLPADRRDEFLRTVLKWKPIHSWGIAIVEWTQ